MAELTYPNRVNTQGMPTLAGTPSVVSIGGTDTLVVEFNPHLALNADWSGAFWVNITQAVATGAQPVVFSTIGEQGYTPLYMYGGSQATAADLVTTTGGIIMCFFDYATRRLQLVGTYL